MAKKKLSQYNDLATFENVTQPDIKELEEGYSLKGKWARDYFKNEYPIVLELGCGKGEYTVNLAKAFPQKNFIGVDIKGARLWTGSVQTQELSLSNVAFLRLDISFITKVFGPGEVSEIWIPFPDPQPKNRQAKKRLTNPRFLKMYGNLLEDDGLIHLKTDNLPFHDYTLEIIEQEGHELQLCTNDLYHSGFTNPLLSIKTHYEKKFLKQGLPITYLKFKPLSLKDSKDGRNFLSEKE